MGIFCRTCSRLMISVVSRYSEGKGWLTWISSKSFKFQRPVKRLVAVGLSEWKGYFAPIVTVSLGNQMFGKLGRLRENVGHNTHCGSVHMIGSVYKINSLIQPLLPSSVNKLLRICRTFPREIDSTLMVLFLQCSKLL